MEVIVEAELLELAVRVEKRARIPPADVLDGGVVRRDHRRRQLPLHGEGLRAEAVEAEAIPRQGDVGRDVRRLEPELVGLDPIALEEVGREAPQDESGEHEADRRDGQPDPAAHDVGDAEHGSDEGQPDEAGEPGEADVHVGVGGTKHDAVVAREEVISLERIVRCGHEQEHSEQRGEVSGCPGAQVEPLHVDFIARPVHPGCRHGGEEDEHERPIAHRPQGRHGEDVESEVVAEDRIDAPERSGVQPFEEDFPVAGLREPDHERQERRR